MSTDRNVSELLIRICHDLRTPIRSIRSHTELLRRDLGVNAVPGFEEGFGFVAASAHALDHFIDRLAIYAAALGASSADAQPIPASALLRGAVAKLRSSLPGAAIQVNSGELPVVNANPDLLMRVFEELLRNAALFSGLETPMVDIAAAPEGGFWLFRVQDNGRGVDPGDLEQIFRPFERLDGNGTGLGLAICQALVEGHGGKIWAARAPDGGLRVNFTLPN